MRRAVDSTAWKKIICSEQRKEDKHELHLDQIGKKKSISLLPSYVITECQRWHEGVALRINHVPSASMTALVIVMSTKGCGDQTGAVMTSSKCHTHTQYDKHPCLSGQALFDLGRQAHDRL